VSLERDELMGRIDRVRANLFEAVVEGEPLVIVKAPPGSGKTRVIVEATALLESRGMRVAIAGQTNSQANDICRRVVEDFGIEVTRFASSGNPPSEEEVGGATIVTDKGDLPSGRCVVVSTASKWGFTEPSEPFDWLLVDEAWQLAYVGFMMLDQIAPRFVMVGDPGQIAPVITVDTARWATAPFPPHVAVPDLLIDAEGVDPAVLELPASFRLPEDSVRAVVGFYDFPFEAWVRPGDRSISFESAGADSPADAVLDNLEKGSIVGATLSTPPEGPPLESDLELADAATNIASRMLERRGQLLIDGEKRELEAADIGFCATHRLMNARIRDRLPENLKDCMVDTAERWQGLERPIMIIIHPVSGTVSPTTFDLQTERLCVMASRHKVGLVVLTRDHLEDTLNRLLPLADQHVGLPDVTGSGLARQKSFWAAIRGADRVTHLN
jgi:hypothetical protein